MALYRKKSSLKKLIAATALALVSATTLPLVSTSGFVVAQEATEGRQFSAKAGEAVNAALQLK